MSRAHEEYYGNMYASKRRQQDEIYNRIIADFEALTLEEKVDKLIKIYAAKRAYK